MRTLVLVVPAILLLPVACGSGSSGGASSSGPVSPSLSGVSVPVPHGIPSDGVAAADIVVTLRDPNGAPVTGREVSLAASGVQNFFWPGSTVSTDGDGRAEFRMTSTAPGSKQLTVTAGSGGSIVTLEQTPAVGFEPPTIPRERASVSSAGDEGNDFSRQAAVSGDGRFVAFQSKASNLVPGDTNQKEDVFVHDLRTGTTERVSFTPSGAQFSDLCGEPSLSDDGNLVAFQGRESDDDAVFVRDRAGRITEPISDATSLNGRCFDPSLSGDGRHVAFVCNDGEAQHVWVFDRWTSALTLVSKSSNGTPGDDPSYAPSISRDGRYVAFASTADNLVSGDTNEKDDVFVHDLRSGSTRRVSVSSSGAEGDDDSMEPSIAADGRFVAFASKAQNLVPGDDNGKIDVFVHDMTAGATDRVSVDPQGREVDKESWMPDISSDGLFVVFSSLSDDLVPDDTNGKEDVFRRDLARGVTVRVSLGLGATDPDEFSTGPALASDAPVVAFTSKAQNLVPRDENDQEDVFTAPRD